MGAAESKQQSVHPKNNSVNINTNNSQNKSQNVATNIDEDIRFEIKDIDVNNDGIIDHNDVRLVIMYKNNVEVSRKEVPIEKVISIFKEGIINDIEAKVEGKTDKETERVGYVKGPANPNDKQVIVYEDPNFRERMNFEMQMLNKQMEQDNKHFKEATSFWNYAKAGAGLTMGSAAVDVVASGLMSLFTDGGSKRKYKKRNNKQQKRK